MRLDSYFLHMFHGAVSYVLHMIVLPSQRSLVRLCHKKLINKNTKETKAYWNSTVSFSLNQDLPR